MKRAPLTYLFLYLKAHFLQILHAPSLPGTVPVVCVVVLHIGRILKK